MERKTKTKSLLDVLNKQKSGEKVDQLFQQVMSLKSKSEDSKASYLQKFNTNMQYYYGMLPGNTLVKDSFSSYTGRKEHVEQVLYRVVNADIPILLDSFTSDKSLACAIRSRGYRRNPDLEQIVTLEINKHFRDNDGYALLRNAIKTLLIAGNSDLKVYVDESTERDSIDFGDEWIELTEFLSSLDDGWTLEAPKTFTDKSGKYKGLEWKEVEEKQPDPKTGKMVKIPYILIRGKVPIINRIKKLVIEEIEPQDVWFDTTYGYDMEKIPYICHKIKTTVGEAELRGFDSEKLENASDNKEDDIKLPEMYFVDYQNPTNLSESVSRNVTNDEKMRPITLYEHYVKSSIPSKNEEVRRYQVITTDSEILKVTEIKRFPFVHGLLEQVQGQFYGRGWGEVVKPYQDARSIAHRIHEHAALCSAMPQWLAVKGQYDRQSLQNNRPGAVFEQMTLNGVQRMPQFEVGQTFLTAMDALRQSEEETLAQPVGVTNSDGGIPQVATATAYLSIFQDSQKGAIRKQTIEQTLINPLFTLMYEICKDEGMITAPDGTVIDSKHLPNLYDVIIDTDTTHDDFAQQMQLANFAGMAMQLAQIQTPYLNDVNKFAVLSEFLNKADLDVNKFLTDPSQIQQDPHAAAEQARAAAIESERHSVTLQSEVLDMWLKGAKVITEQATAEKITKEVHNTMSKDQADSYAKIQNILLAAQNKAKEIEVKGQEVEVKNKAVNYETILAAQKHASDITSPQINGVR